MMVSEENKKIIVQCDFDGTVTEEDVSFLLLDTFADGDWRYLLRDYRAGKINAGYLNREAFSMIKADRQSLIDIMKGTVKIRSGFQELVSYCRSEGIRFVIVSNGLDFYIEKILTDLGLQDIEVYAARTQFHSGSLHVQYIGPDGNVMDEGFKESYVNLFKNNGYQVVYIGDGLADFLPARLCHYIFATRELLNNCKEKNVDCIAFTDLNEVIKGIELIR